jgi:paraquat-inducible protein B
MLKNLARLDLAGLEQKVTSLITKLDSMLSDLRLNEITGQLTNALGSVQRVVETPDLTNSFTSLRNTLEQYRLLAEKVNHRVDPLADGLTNVLHEIHLTLGQTRDGIQSLDSMVAPDSALRHELSLTLDQLTEASRSIAALADLLQSQPNALLTGRGIIPKKP